MVYERFDGTNYDIMFEVYGSEVLTTDKSCSQKINLNGNAYLPSVTVYDGLAYVVIIFI